ncbi:SUR7 (YML052W) [Zygosaccharomyces parabailii]|nr:SUR7 (YML052W) [Zygosaccharomyces parabailii]CDH09175.1 related to Protein SUR7 [Zygosaccharomyces bailii ISA1307]
MARMATSIWSCIVKASTLIFFAGNVLLLLLIIISGGSDNYPMSRLYWVEGDTSGIPHASNTTRWTYWGACSRSNGRTNCGGSLGPAYPISPVDNFGTKTNVPHKFISNRDSFYYLTRLAFSFFWIALSFIAISFLIYVGAWFSNAVSHVTWILTGVGCLFNIVAVIFQTAAAVMARDAFTDDKRHGKLGAPLLGIAWASVALCLIEFTSLVAGHIVWSRPSKDERNYEKAELPSVKITPTSRSNSTRSVHPFRTFFLGQRNARTYDENLSKQRDAETGYTISSGTTEGANGTESREPAAHFAETRRSNISSDHSFESVDRDLESV